jgi:flagellar biosynthesis protein FlhG
MPDRSCGPRGRPAHTAPRDQAAGLRRLFAPAEPHWLPVLLACERDPVDAGWLAALARACADQGARTLIVDAARAQVAAAFGLRARYDLAHALSGDCAPQEACVPAGPNLRILPAARALERNGRDPARSRGFEAGVRALAAAADCAVLVLPAHQGRSLKGFFSAGGATDAIVAVGPGSDSERRALETMRSILSVADIDTFRLLFQDTDPACAGSLYSRLAAAGARQVGAKTSNAGSVHDAAAIRRLVRLVRCRSTPRAEGAGAERGGTAVETVS